MKNIYVIAGAIVLSGAMVSGAVLFTNETGVKPDSLKGQAVNDTTETENEIIKTDSRDIDIEGWPTKGDLNAPIVLIEYSDYACPFCKRLSDEAMSEIQANYVESGEVLRVFKDFAVVGGNLAAEAAHCAGEQDSYWEYHNILFENQTEDRGQWNNPETHKKYANQLGLNSDDLLECFQERRYKDKVIKSTQEAQALGGKGSPYIIINEQSIPGAQPYQVFEAVIKQEQSKL
jgi:protein-disulfide isomerase